jgi:dolichyl-phosphate beta-glucosyltransferase
MKSVIIPAYNEAENIERVVKATLELEDVEVIISDDGSTDDTDDIARELKKFKNVLLVSDENKGKGAAIKRGLSKASGDVMGFLDADMSAHPKELLKLFKEIENGADVAIGSRGLSNSVILVKQSVHRRLLGGVYGNFTRKLFKLDIKDFQCGLKVFKKEVWNNINVDTNGFVFDTEFIIKAHKKGYIIKEVPIIWQDSHKSEVNPILDSIKMFIELIKMKKLI